MNATTEDLPTRIPPTRRMVYGAFTLSFDVLMFPCLRNSISLGNTSAVIGYECCGNLPDSRSNDLIVMGILVVCWSLPMWTSRIAHRFAGRDFTSAGPQVVLEND